MGIGSQYSSSSIGGGAEGGNPGEVKRIYEMNTTLGLTPEPQQQQHRRTRPLVRRISSSDRSAVSQIESVSIGGGVGGEGGVVGDGDGGGGGLRERSRVENLPPAIQV